LILGVVQLRVILGPEDERALSTTTKMLSFIYKNNLPNRGANSLVQCYDHFYNVSHQISLNENGIFLENQCYNHFGSYIKGHFELKSTILLPIIFFKS
jgi:hypothetical protein